MKKQLQIYQNRPKLKIKYAYVLTTRRETSAIVVNMFDISPSNNRPISSSV